MSPAAPLFTTRLPLKVQSRAMREDFGWQRARRGNRVVPSAPVPRRRIARFGLPRRSGPSFAHAVLLVLAFGALAGWGAGRSLPAGDSPVSGGLVAARSFSLCFTGGGTNCVVDGDTFWIDGKKVRIADIDAPETHPPRCDEESALGERATLRLQALLNAGPVSLIAADRDTDRYGRKLRTVSAAGVRVGSTLVAEGLARPWTGHRRPWCGAI